MAKRRPILADPGPVASADDPSPAARPDPRWSIMPKARLTPAMTFVLMTGSPADLRLRGWVASAQAGTYGEPDPETVWAAHSDRLIAEARTHGFEPYRLTHRTPTGAGFEQWRQRFLTEHTY